MSEEAASVLDASAVLVLLRREAGHEAVAARLGGSRMSAVNLAEVTSKLADAGLADAQVRTVIDALRIDVTAFDADQAHDVGRLRPATRASGLSLADRACLALGLRLGLPVVTADRAWADLGLGVDVVLVR